MHANILVIAEHLKGRLSGIVFEMLGKAHALATETGGGVEVLLMGHGVRALAEELGLASRVLLCDHPALAAYTPQACLDVAEQVIARRAPDLVLIASSSMGLDIAAPLSVRLGVPHVSSCRDLRITAGRAIVTSQMYGGKMLVESHLDLRGAIVSVLPGAFPEDAGRIAREAVIEALPVEGLDAPHMRFTRLIEQSGTDIDITQTPVLIAVGRGIQNRENIAMVEELAAIAQGAVCASRPVVDQGWLPMTRQIGRSGMIVKPKLYMALGISGAPEHVEGMKDAELIVAVNTDAQAPIFGIAHYGVVADIADVVPALTEALRNAHAPA
ncbi:MAG: electron transfer flavoprotein subunit alpha/FixB family protein [Ignavibacteria bacterium]|nr:electron transfer flavoprotein subunit alpha/FixB family protein [Ignavibacteria bacterium]